MKEIWYGFEKVEKDTISMDEFELVMGVEIKNLKRV